MDPHLCASSPACNGFFRFTSGVTAADLLTASMATEHFWTKYFFKHSVRHSGQSKTMTPIEIIKYLKDLVQIQPKVLIYSRRSDKLTNPKGDPRKPPPLSFIKTMTSHNPTCSHRFHLCEEAGLFWFMRHLWQRTWFSFEKSCFYINKKSLADLALKNMTDILHIKFS